MSKRVLVTDNLAPEGVRLLQETPGLEVIVRPKMSHQELREAIAEVHALVVRSATTVDAEVIETARHLEVIGRAGTGVDNIDLQAATRRGVVVMNAPEANALSTAEHTISLMLALARNVPQACASLKGGRWEKKRFLGSEVFSKTLGIVGLGRVGRAVAERARGLGMHVVAYDPYIASEAALRLEVEMLELDELLERSDYVSLHVPLTEETRGLLSAERLRRMKRGARLINCARGGLIDEEALREVLEDGHLAGAALDVFAQEPPPPDHPLLKLEQVICTPHLGASTAEAQANVARAIAEQIADFLLRGAIRNAVNFPPVSRELYQVLQPYLDLAERLGAFQAQLLEGGLEEVEIQYSGQLLEYDLPPLSAYLLKGLMWPLLGEGVTFVNAPLLVRERGIKVVESKVQDHEDFTSLLALRVRTTQGESRVAGTIFGKREPRLVQVDGFRLEAPPEGHMLVIQAHDRPGLIGNVGTILAEAGINIGRMHFGREATGGRALIVLSTDVPTPQEVRGRLHQVPQVISLRRVELP